MEMESVLGFFFFLSFKFRISGCSLEAEWKCDSAGAHSPNIWAGGAQPSANGGPDISPLFDVQTGISALLRSHSFSVRMK